MLLTMVKREEKKLTNKDEFSREVFGDNDIWSIKGGAGL